MTKKIANEIKERSEGLDIPMNAWPNEVNHQACHSWRQGLLRLG